MRVHHPLSIAETKDGVTIKVLVKPNSPKFKIEIDGEEIVIYSTKAPVKGKANKEIIKELTKLFHAKTELVSGATSRQKKIFLSGIEKQQAEQLLKLA
jgi:uncharacterized protein (TIGR00251 family)